MVLRAIRIHDPFRRMLLRHCAARGCHRANAFRFFHAQLQRASEIVHQSGSHEESGFPVSHELRNTADARCDHRNTRRERFEDDARLILRDERWHHEHIGLRDGRAHAVRIEPTTERQATDAARRATERRGTTPIADDLQRDIGIRAPNSTERLHEYLHALHTFHLSHEHETAYRAIACAYRSIRNIDRISDNRHRRLQKKSQRPMAIEEPPRWRNHYRWIPEHAPSECT